MAKKPPDYQEASCCGNCDHFNGRQYHNCMKHNADVEYSMICLDYTKEIVKMIAKDYLRLKKKNK